MPILKEIQWSQLKVGALVLVAMAVLIGLIFLMSGSSGGLFAPKLIIRSYFENAAGLKRGAPVTLEGVTIGNVIQIRVVPARNPTPVEVTMRLGREYISDLHTDSTASITQQGVLGDSFVDIDSSHASGPPPANGSELKSVSSPTIQDVITSSQGGIEQLAVLIGKLDTVVDAINKQRGAIGRLVNDPKLARKFDLIATNLQAITTNLKDGQGTLGKLLTDDSAYNHFNSAATRLDSITANLEEGKGSAGKLLHDDSLYKNLNSTVANANQLLAQINAGKGALGKLAKDPAFAQKLDDTITRLDSIAKGVDEGRGTMGQLFKNRSLYDHADQTMEQTRQLVQSIREDPRKYLVIRLKLF